MVVRTLEFTEGIFRTLREPLKVVISTILLAGETFRSNSSKFEPETPEAGTGKRSGAEEGLG